MAGNKDHQRRARASDYSARNSGGIGSMNVLETLKISDSECAELIEKLNTEDEDRMNDRTKLLLKKLTETLKILDRSMTNEAKTTNTVIRKVEDALRDAKSGQFREKERRGLERAIEDYRNQLMHGERKSQIQYSNHKKWSKEAKRRNLDKLRKIMRRRFLDAKKRDGSEPASITRPAHWSERKFEIDKTEPKLDEDRAVLKCRSKTEENNSALNDTHRIRGEFTDLNKTSILDVNDVDLSLAERLRNPESVMKFSSQHEDAGAKLSTPATETVVRIHQMARLLVQDGRTRWSSNINKRMISLIQKIESKSDHMLHKAAANGNVESLRKILDSGRVHVDCADEEGTTALMLACSNGHMECAKLLIEDGADVSAQRQTGTHALCFAAQNGDLNILELLLSAGAKVDLQNRDGGTPLFVAAQCGKLMALQFLARKGANVNCEIKDGATALFVAAQNGHLPVVRFLLSKNAIVDKPRQDGATPLWIASQMGHTAIVKELLNNGANVDAPREDGATPIFKAAHKGHDAVVDVLLESKPSVSLCKNGESALHAACLFGHLSVVQSLVTAGADPFLKNKCGETPEELAHQIGYDDIVDYLKKFEKPTKLRPMHSTDL